MASKLPPTPSFPFPSDPNSLMDWAQNFVQSIIREFTNTNVRSNAMLPGDGSESAVAPVMLATYTVSTLPTAASYTAGIIFVANGTSNKRLAVSDGTNWRWPDGAIVS